MRDAVERGIGRPLSKNAYEMGSKPARVIPADPFWEADLLPHQVEPDSRWQNLMIGAYEDLEEEVSSWERGPYVSQEIDRMLSVARSLFLHSYFVHEFAVVAVVWSLLAIEASLRLVLGTPASDMTSFKKLIGQAHGRGLLTREEMVQLEAGRGFRNRLVHSDGQKTFSLGMSVPLLVVSHLLTARLFERAETGRDLDGSHV